MAKPTKQKDKKPDDFSKSPKRNTSALDYEDERELIEAEAKR